MSENQNKNNQKISMPVLLDEATVQINAYVTSVMQSKGVPPEMMIYVLKDILLDLYEAKTCKMAAVIAGMEGEKHGD